MEQSKTQKERYALTDFLYKDAELLNSFYAQIFGGNLTGISKCTSENGEQTTTLKSSIPVVNVSNEGKKSKTNSLNENLDPHDTKILDIFDKLNIKEYEGEISECSNGQILLIKGHVKFRDFSAIHSLIPIIDSFMSGTAQAQEIQMMKPLFSVFPTGIEVVLSSPSTEFLIPIKESGLTMSSDDIIRTYGNDLTGKWNVIGILDQIRNINIQNPNQDIRGISDTLSYEFRKITNSNFKYSLKPIVIYRNLNY